MDRLNQRDSLLLLSLTPLHSSSTLKSGGVRWEWRGAWGGGLASLCVRWPPVQCKSIELKSIAKLVVFCYSVLVFFLISIRVLVRKFSSGEGGFEPPIPLQVCRYENRIQWCRFFIENHNLIEIFSQTVRATFGAYGFQETLFLSLFNTLACGGA